MIFGIVWRSVLFSFFVSAVDVLFNGSQAVNMMRESTGGFVVMVVVLAFGLMLGEYITKQRAGRNVK